MKTLNKAVEDMGSIAKVKKKKLMTLKKMTIHIAKKKEVTKEIWLIKLKGKRR